MFTASTKRRLKYRNHRIETCRMNVIAFLLALQHFCHGQIGYEKSIKRSCLRNMIFLHTNQMNILIGGKLSISFTTNSFSFYRIGQCKSDEYVRINDILSSVFFFHRFKHRISECGSWSIVDGSSWCRQQFVGHGRFSFLGQQQRHTPE